MSMEHQLSWTSERLSMGQAKGIQPPLDQGRPEATWLSVCQVRLRETDKGDKAVLSTYWVHL